MKVIFIYLFEAIVTDYNINNSLNNSNKNKNLKIISSEVKYQSIRSFRIND